MAVIFFIVGCSGSSSTTDPAQNSDSSSQEPSTLIPAGLLLLEDDVGLLSDIPNVVASEILASSGLQLAYTASHQIETVPALLVEAQWLHMQTCLGQVAAVPVVVVIDGPVSPLTSEDDVIFNIDGVPIASASRRDATVIQVRDTDFDGSLGAPGFNLRSIMGRYIWLSNALAEGDYPFDCARTQVGSA